MAPQHRAKALHLSLLIALVLPASAPAEDGGFLWNPSGSAGDLSLRTGIALDVQGRPRLGAESNLRVATAVDPGTLKPPIRLWGEFDVLPSDVAPMSVGVRLDLVSGAARAALRQSRTVIDEERASLSFNRTLEMGRRGDGESVFVARQDMHFAFAEVDAAMTGGIVMDNKAPFRAELGLEKRLYPGLSLRASLSDLAHEPAARFKARFERQW